MRIDGASDGRQMPARRIASVRSESIAACHFGDTRFAVDQRVEGVSPGEDGVAPKLMAESDVEAWRTPPSA